MTYGIDGDPNQYLTKEEREGPKPYPQTLSDIAWVIAILAGGVLIILFGMLSVVWQFRNPTANPSTVFTHFSDVMHVRALPQFQEHL